MTQINDAFYFEIANLNRALGEIIALGKRIWFICVFYIALKRICKHTKTSFADYMYFI